MAKPVAPAQPRIRVSRDVAASTRLTPYFLEGNQEDIEAAINSGQEGKLYSDPTVFAVAVGELKYRHYLAYEDTYGQPLDVAVNITLYTLYVTAKLFDQAISEEEREKITATVQYDEETRTTKTPYGVMHGSVERNIMDILAYILSRFGKITAKIDNGVYECAPITPDDVLDRVGRTMLVETIDDKKTVYQDILELSGVSNPTLMAKGLQEDGALKDDELKNSASETKDS